MYSLLDESEDSAQDHEMFDFSNIKTPEKVIHKHLKYSCSSPEEKFNLIFHFITNEFKMKKVVIYFENLLDANRLKIMCDKHRIASFLVSPDLHRARVSAVMHHFTKDNLDCLILMNQGYAKTPH